MHAANGADALFLLQGQGAGRGKTGKHRVDRAEPHDHIAGIIPNQTGGVSLIGHDKKQPRMPVVKIYDRAETFTDFR